MSRVITFSRTFPAYHPKAGRPTNFVERVLNSVQSKNYWFAECSKCGWMGSSSVMDGGGQIADTGDYDDPMCPKCGSTSYKDLDAVDEDYYIGWFDPKNHTIRAGNRWKVGDKFSPRVWSGKPYNCKQIIIAPDIEILKVWSFEMIPSAWLDECRFLIGGNEITDSAQLREVAAHDGLDPSDFIDWFTGGNLRDHKRKPFTGQILCWNDEVNY